MKIVGLLMLQKTRKRKERESKRLRWRVCALGEGLLLPRGRGVSCLSPLSFSTHYVSRSQEPRTPYRSARDAPLIPVGSELAAPIGYLCLACETLTGCDRPPSRHDTPVSRK